MSLSPRGTDTLSLDDTFVDNKRVTTFGVLTRRLTINFIPRSNDDVVKNQFNLDDSFRSIKMQILKYNPMIYELFRESLVEKFYTDFTVCYMLNRFLDEFLRIPEIREDIVSHRLAYSTHRSRNSNTTSGLFAYLTGESSSPTSQKKPIALTRAETEGKSSSELRLPSLDIPRYPCDDHGKGMH